jgi:hypothetical protein
MRTDAAKVIGSMMQLALEQTPKNFELTGKQVYPILYTKNIFVRTGYVMNISEWIDINRNGIHLTTRSVFAEIHTKHEERRPTRCNN